MTLTSSARARTFAAIAVAVALTACSLLVNKDKDQCSSASDCGPAGAAMCLDGVCVVGGGGEGGLDATAEGAPPADGPVTTDGGCTPKMPVTQDDFINEKCTNAQCIQFDNCARVGLCPGVDGGDGGLPALVTPPLGGI